MSELTPVPEQEQTPQVLNQKLGLLFRQLTQLNHSYNEDLTDDAQARIALQSQIRFLGSLSFLSEPGRTYLANLVNEASILDLDNEPFDPYAVSLFDASYATVFGWDDETKGGIFSNGEAKGIEQQMYRRALSYELLCMEGNDDYEQRDEMFTSFLQRTEKEQIPDRLLQEALPEESGERRDIDFNQGLREMVQRAVDQTNLVKKWPGMFIAHYDDQP